MTKQPMRRTSSEGLVFPPISTSPRSQPRSRQLHRADSGDLSLASLDSEDSPIGGSSLCSVLSLEDSIHVATALSSLSPVKDTADLIDAKLDRIERQLDQLHSKRDENWELEMEWKRREAEIFGVAEEGLTKGSPKERRNRKREKFLKKMAQPKRGREKLVTDGIAETYHGQVERRAREKPGIGEYNTFNGSLDDRGGKFSMACPKSDVDWMIYRAAQTKMSYVKLPSTLRRTGGTFSKSAKPMTKTDWTVKRAKELPGPGQYDTRPLEEKLGNQHRGKFSLAKPKTDVERQVQRGLESPGSHILLPSTLKKSGGIFNQSAKPLTERDWQVKRAKELPGPGEYQHAELKSAGGGKFNTGNSKNDVEWKIYNSRHTPGPGGYDLSRAMDASSQHQGIGAGGKFTMVYRPTEDSGELNMAKGTVEAEELAAVRRHTISLSPMEIRRASVSMVAAGAYGGGPGSGTGTPNKRMSGESYTPPIAVKERRHTLGAPTRGDVLWKEARKLLDLTKQNGAGGGGGVQNAKGGDQFGGKGLSFLGGGVGGKGGVGGLAAASVAASFGATTDNPSSSERKSGRSSVGMASLFGVAVAAMQKQLVPGEGDEEEEEEEGSDNDSGGSSGGGGGGSSSRGGCDGCQHGGSKAGASLDSAIAEEAPP